MLTYLDSNILIAAAKAPERRGGPIWRILSDPSRSYAVSHYLAMEVLPYANFHHRTLELRFLERFFERASHWASCDTKLVEEALTIAMEDGLNGMDALHLACALQVGADEFVTAENPRKSRLALTNRLPVRLI